MESSPLSFVFWIPPSISTSISGRGSCKTAGRSCSSWSATSTRHRSSTTRSRPALGSSLLRSKPSGSRTVDGAACEEDFAVERALLLMGDPRIARDGTADAAVAARDDGVAKFSTVEAGGAFLICRSCLRTIVQVAQTLDVSGTESVSARGRWHSTKWGHGVLQSADLLQ